MFFKENKGNKPLVNTVCIMYIFILCIGHTAAAGRIVLYIGP